MTPASFVISAIYDNDLIHDSQRTAIYRDLWSNYLSLSHSSFKIE